jgi:elongation factor P
VINATQIKKGMLIKMDDVPFIVLKVSHITPGKGRAFIQCVLRNLKSGFSKDMRFRSNDRVEETEIEPVEMEYIYTADKWSTYTLLIICSISWTRKVMNRYLWTLTS